ncbi:MAG TPA: aminoacyl-tRNA hydrolase, partial [Mesotoga sp.]|nr:aminoacyl-tRNA hydrolase [Mesotoga sp.]
MFLFIGLGNPGPRYVFTRHNVGFLFVDEMMRNGVRKTSKKKIYEAYLLEGEPKIYLAKPLTFMNLSDIA